LISYRIRSLPVLVSINLNSVSFVLSRSRSHSFSLLRLAHAAVPVSCRRVCVFACVCSRARGCVRAVTCRMSAVEWTLSHARSLTRARCRMHGRMRVNARLARMRAYAHPQCRRARPTTRTYVQACRLARVRIHATTAHHANARADTLQRTHVKQYNQRANQHENRRENRRAYRCLFWETVYTRVYREVYMQYLGVCRLGVVRARRAGRKVCIYAQICAHVHSHVGM
jgi:hypothetical protein